jgi:hypothetical protein
MRLYLLLLSGLICAAGPSLFASGIDATATFTDSQVSPGVNQYNLTLNDTGSTTIGTFWFSWIPGSDFMPVSPTDITAPSGWQDVVTHGGAGDGYAILWTASTPANDLAPGSSLSGFSFDSTLTPADLASPSVESPSDLVNTAFSYINAPLADPGVKFNVTPAIASTPEPTTTFITGLGFLLIVLCTTVFRKRRPTPNP